MKVGGDEGELGICGSDVGKIFTSENFELTLSPESQQSNVDLRCKRVGGAQDGSTTKRNALASRILEGSNTNLLRTRS
jgi:hypothetical protein